MLSDAMILDAPASLRPTAAVIDLRALRHNLDFIRRTVGVRCGILSVVKADGYGHGMVPIARECLRWGVQGLAVGTADEALELRNSEGCTAAPILVMGPTLPDDAAMLLDASVSVAVGSVELLRAHLRAAQRLGRPAQIHIKLDTGMGRGGFRPEDPVWFDLVRQHPQDIEGLFTHFASSESPLPEDMRFTNEQRERFEAAVRRVFRLGIRPVYHAANSGGVLYHPATHFEMVRPGILQYGAEPSPQHMTGAALHPVLSLRSKVMAIYPHRRGETISYGRTYTLPADAPIGVVPVGYGDGYPRALSNKADVLVHGTRVPVVGRVTMDQILVNLSAVPQARPGDDAVLVGAQGQHRISLEEIAELAGTIPYEFTCQLSKRVPRVYVNAAE